MLARVGEALLDDAVGGRRGGGIPRCAAAGLVDALVHVHLRAAQPGFVDKRGQVVQPDPGLKQTSRAGRSVAQDSDHILEVSQRVVAGLPDDSGHGAGLLRRQVGAELKRTGVDAQKGQAVGERVVHLPGYPATFLVPGGRRKEFLADLEIVCMVQDRPKVVALGTDHQAPARHGQVHQAAHDDLRAVAEARRLGIHQRKAERRDQLRRGQCGDHGSANPDRRGEQGDQRGTGGKRGHG